MTNKEEYSLWAANQEYMPLMMQPWWMDAVCAGKQWDVLLVKNADGKILGALPYLLRERLWMRFIIMPQQTQIGGIWVDASITHDQWQVAEVCRQFSQQLRDLRISYYYQQYPVKSLCIQPMRALGFRLRERTTYRIEDLSDMEELINRFSKNKKRQLRKAEEQLHAERGMSGEEFYQFHARCMREQRKRITYSREFLLVLERKLRRRKQCDVISIRDAAGELHAAAFLVWDNRLLYYLIPCFSPSFKDSGASALLVKEAIALAHELHLQFDFEGSNHRGVAQHYSQFASTPITYYSAERYYNPLFRLLSLCNSLRNKKYGL